MTAALQKLQIRRRELKIPDAEYRALLRRITGQESSRGLSDAQLIRVIDALEGGDGRRQADGEIPAKIRALAWDLYELGAWRDGRPTERSIARFVKRQTGGDEGVDDLRWLAPDRVSSVVEAMRAMLRRVGLDLPARVSPARAEELLLIAQWRRMEALDGVEAGAYEAARLEATALPGADRRHMIRANGEAIRWGIKEQKGGGDA